MDLRSEERSRLRAYGDWCNGFVPKYFGVEGMQFSTFPQSLSILYSNANLLDPDLARIGPSASACVLQWQLHLQAPLVQQRHH